LITRALSLVTVTPLTNSCTSSGRNTAVATTARYSPQRTGTHSPRLNGLERRIRAQHDREEQQRRRLRGERLFQLAHQGELVHLDSAGPERGQIAIQLGLDAKTQHSVQETCKDVS
jgi:hypothetical protein